MRLSFQHPVIVSGTADDGRSRHDLVRVTGEFDIAEIDAADAPVSFEGVTGNGRSLHVRTFEGRHYRKKWVPAGNISEGTHYHGELVAGTDMDFHSIGQDIQRAAGDIGVSSGRVVRNVERKVSKRDNRNGLTRSGKACLDAPILRNWRWLSADVDKEIAAWHAVVAEKLANVVEIEGVYYERCFEPCLVLSAHMGKALFDVRSRGVYQSEVHKTEYDHEGLVLMGRDALHTLSYYYPGSEPEGPREMAEALGWRIEKTKAHLDVFDHSAVSVDFFEMETMRHARIVLSYGKDIARSLNRPSSDAARKALGGEFEAAHERLKENLVEWQYGGVGLAGIEAALGPFGDLFERVPDFAGDRYAPSVEDAKRCVEQFALRQDSGRISVLDFAPRPR